MGDLEWLACTLPGLDVEAALRCAPCVYFGKAHIVVDVDRRRCVIFGALTAYG